MMGRRRFPTRGRCNSENRCGGDEGANRYRTRDDPGGSARTRVSTACSGGCSCARLCTGGALRLSKHMQRNRKRYNQQECNAN